MDSVSGVGVVDKAVSVLRALSAGPCTLGDMQQRTGMPRATAHRLATALEAHGLVRRDGSGRFALGMDLVALGRAAADGLPIARVSLPVLQALRDTTGEGVQLYVREGDQRRCVVSLQSVHGLRWIVPEGVLLPLELGSAGHVLAGEPLTRGGWLQSVEEREPGVASVSAPVHDRHGAVVAAVSISGPVGRLTRQPGASLGAAVVGAAAAVSDTLAD